MTCDIVLWHVTLYCDMWRCIVTCDIVLWHVTLYCDMWHCAVTCNIVLWHVTLYCDMWHCIVTCDIVLWHVTLYYDTQKLVSDAKASPAQCQVLCLISNVCYSPAPIHIHVVMSLVNNWVYSQVIGWQPLKLWFFSLHGLFATSSI